MLFRSCWILKQSEQEKQILYVNYSIWKYCRLKYVCSEVKKRVDDFGKITVLFTTSFNFVYLLNKCIAARQ
jgi:hypothetical protein